ncbi:MAG: hypothetical protein KatS3mg068_1477 [Candidatus Sericytochromatia bacterium]|nr:MAG: hypothetical protein KatS3mg068_1477 [Candidatus Sericytochromatia bacterium]
MNEKVSLKLAKEHEEIKALSLEDISEITGLPIEEIENLKL